MILVDTNVISEPLRKAPHTGVIEWIDAQPLETLYLSAITVAELRFGVAALPRRETPEHAARQPRNHGPSHVHRPRTGIRPRGNAGICPPDVRGAHSRTGHRCGRRLHRGHCSYPPHGSRNARHRTLRRGRHHGHQSLGNVSGHDRSSGHRCCRSSAAATRALSQTPPLPRRQRCRTRPTIPSGGRSPRSSMNCNSSSWLSSSNAGSGN